MPDDSPGKPRLAKGFGPTEPEDAEWKRWSTGGGETASDDWPLAVSLADAIRIADAMHDAIRETVTYANRPLLWAGCRALCRYPS